MKMSITFPIDTDQLESFTDTYLAQLWHIAQANPAPIEDRDSGRLAEMIGREIIRRWLGASTPELFHHQGEHHFWYELQRNAEWSLERGWVPKSTNGGSK